MSTTVPIVINGTTIQLPATGSSPEWSEAILQAFQLIAKALSLSVGEFDIPPQIFTMTSNVNTNVPITNLNFPITNVNGAVVFYNVSRSTTGIGATQVSESGILILNYNSAGSTNNKWQLNKEWGGPGAQTSFYTTDLGQVEFSTTSITGSNHVGSIYFRALAVLNNN